MANHYEIPSWAGKPPVGMHLDVMKADKLIQKLMIDEKKCYLFGRNSALNDFCIDHASCSRVHAALIYHKHLNRAFLVDLGSTHGTFVGSARLESNKPTQLPVDSTFHFGVSTRLYVLRERPQTATRSTDGPGKKREVLESGLCGLTQTQTELDNLTEFNTARNKRISMLGISEDIKPKKKRKSLSVGYNFDEEIINPEDVDPSIGKFRNLVQSSVIPNKRDETTNLFGKALMSSGLNKRKNYSYPPSNDMSCSGRKQCVHYSIKSSKFGLYPLNPAPDVDLAPPVTTFDYSETVHSSVTNSNLPLETNKKKYAKEAWPGKKPIPTSSLLV